MDDLAISLPLTCEQCGGPRAPRTKRFCSRACQGASFRRGVPWVCQNCGRSEIRSPSYAVRPYCSMRCGGEARATRVLRACEHCGKEMRVGTRVRRFCSRECAARSKDVPEEERFWKNVEKTDGCWLWKAYKTKEGRGFFHRTRGVAVPAYRYAYQLAHGPIPKGLEVCHNCPGGDNPACVRPGHMFLGDRKRHVEDTFAKGQMRRHRLSDEAVRLVRSTPKWKGINTHFAAIYGVSANHICQVRLGHLRKDVV